MYYFLFIFWGFLYFSLSAFSQCDENVSLTSLDGNIAFTPKDTYFLYGYYAKEENPDIDFSWLCKDKKILNFNVIESRDSVKNMLEKGFEIAPIDLSESDFEKIWKSRIVLPIETLSTAYKETYHYKILYGKVERYHRYNRSYRIDLSLENETKLFLYIPIAYFDLFDFKKKNFKKGEFIYISGVVEYWRQGFTIQVSHPNQMVVKKDLKIQRAIDMSRTEK